MNWRPKVACNNGVFSASKRLAGRNASFDAGSRILS